MKLRFYQRKYKERLHRVDSIHNWLVSLQYSEMNSLVRYKKFRHEARHPDSNQW